MRIYKTAELGGDLTDPNSHEINPARFEAGVDAAVRALEAAQGIVGTRDLYNMAKQAGPALRMITDPEARYASILAPLIDLGGARTGTGLTAGMRQFMGGSMARHFAEEMQDLGLIKEGNPWKELMPPLGRNGPIILDKDAVVDGALETIKQKGFFAWSQEALKDDLARKGITSAPDINQETYRLFSTETFRRIMSLYTTQAQQVVHDAALMKKIPHIDEQIELLKKDSLAMDAETFNSAYSNMLSRLGAHLKPAAGTRVEGGNLDVQAGGRPGHGVGDHRHRPRSLLGRERGDHRHRGRSAWRTPAATGRVRRRTCCTSRISTIPTWSRSNILLPLRRLEGQQASWFADLTKSITESLTGVAHAEGARPITLTGTMMLDGRAMGEFIGSRGGQGQRSAGQRAIRPRSARRPGDRSGFT